MVLQRDADVKVWGWTSVGEKGYINFIGEYYQTIADKYGKWLVTLSDLKAGGPYHMDIHASNDITFKNI